MADGETGELGRIALKRGDLFREQCYINGKWTGDPTVEVRNPATRGVIGRIPNLGKSETEAAVAAATAALPKWKTETAAARAKIMRKWNDLMVLHQEDLAGRRVAEQADHAQAVRQIRQRRARRQFGHSASPHLEDRQVRRANCPPFPGRTSPAYAAKRNG